MKKTNIIVGIIVVLAVVAVAVLIKQRNPGAVSSPKSSSLPPLTTVFPRDNNRFSISSGAKAGPRLQEGYVNSFYPARVGDMQTISLKAADNSAITSVLVTLETDNKRAAYPLSLAEGDAANGLWKGSWKVSDTHDKIYNIIIYAADKTSSSSVQITLK